MNLDKLNELLNDSEGKILDFKRDFYDFSGVTKEERLDKDAAFIKDVISFANTKRSKTSYIIMGFDESSRTVSGITNFLDDATMQQKIKDKTNPIPQFKVFIQEYQGKNLGIIEIPIVHYPEPCKVTKKMKGLEIGEVYHRRGSSNSIANHHELVEIHNWLSNLVYAEEYVGNDRTIPRFNLKERRSFYVLLFFGTLTLLVYIGQGFTDKKISNIITLPYLILFTYFTFSFLLYITTRYVMSQKERESFEKSKKRWKIFLGSTSLSIWTAFFASEESPFQIFLYLFSFLGIALSIAMVLFYFLFLSHRNDLKDEENSEN